MVPCWLMGSELFILHVGSVPDYVLLFELVSLFRNPPALVTLLLWKIFSRPGEGQGKVLP